MFKQILATATILATLTPLSAHAQSSLPPLTYRAILGVGADETQATVSWRVRNLEPQRVELFPLSNPQDVRVVAARDVDKRADLYRSVEATLTDLQPGTAYGYRIGEETYTFRTSDAQDWSFLALSDAQIGVKMETFQQGATWRHSIKTATERTPDAAFVMSLGDQIEGWGDPIAQYNEFFSAPELRSYRTAVSKGNHDGYMLGDAQFDEHFSLPGERANGDYSYTFNNALFVALNSNLNSPADLAQHEAFLWEAIAGTDKRWVFVTMHHPMYSQGSHSMDADIVRLRDHLTPVFSELGVDVVLSGHDHIYTRANVGGTTYLTTTTAGGGKYYEPLLVDGAPHPWTQRWNQDYTPDALRVQVSADALTLTTTDIPTGNVIDEIRIP